jgi:HJR/Mrr/RecB family endonuclease
MYLSNHPNDLAHVDPFAFEQLIFECLKDSYGADVEVIKVGGRKDRGIDILLIRCQSEKTLVQVKRRRNILLAEGVSVVRELNGVLFREQVAKGMVITTATSFSQEARKEAKIEAVEKHEVALLTFSDVVSLLGIRNYANSYAPWEAFPYELESSWQATHYAPDGW